MPVLGFTAYLATQEHGISQILSIVLVIAGVALTIQELVRRARDKSESSNE